MAKTKRKREWGPIDGGHHLRVKCLLADAKERLGVTWDELAEIIADSKRGKVYISPGTLCRYAGKRHVACAAYTFDVICHFFGETGNEIVVPTRYVIRRGRMRKAM